jgi:HAD superfamily hydrolase (TIGR01509 family)
MNKAFIFDMDGVLLDTENYRLAHDKVFFKELFGEKIAEELGLPIGLSIHSIYVKAVALGFQMPEEEYVKRHDEQAKNIYPNIPLTQNMEKLVDKLVSLHYRLGLVSSSRQNWIELVLDRLSFRDQFQVIISLNDRPDLAPKPNPDGYLEAMKQLGASPKTSIILEDSNTGIKAAKASGALTIGFRQNLIPGYEQVGADHSANNVDDVIRIVESAELKAL